MRVEDLQSKGSGWLIRLHEKGGKQHMMPCHHSLAEALHTYVAAASIGADKKAYLFRTSSTGRSTGDDIRLLVRLDLIAFCP
jgi:hypothetical protein